MRLPWTREPVDHTETVREALSSLGVNIGDLQLMNDMVGYRRMGETEDYLDMQPPAREATVKRSRVFWYREPVADRTLSIWTQFAFGRGWTFQAVDEGFQAEMDAVLNARHNRHQFSRIGWQGHSDTLLVDGERWFVYAVEPNRDVRVRTLDCLEIKDILTNPDDRDEVWYYRRTWQDQRGQVYTRFYRDWDFVTDSGLPRNDRHPVMSDPDPSWGNVDLVPVANQWMSYLKINTLGRRGYPQLTSAFDWLHAYREFMADRSSLSRSRAQFAWRGTVKGPQSVVNRIRSAFDAPNPADPSQGLRNPSGQVAWMNEGVTLDQVGGSSDGQSAQADGRGFRAMAALPSGIPDFMLGDTGSANLATATATMRPIEQMMSSYQDLWVDYMEEMAFHIASFRGWTGNTDVVVDPPSIFADDPWEAARGYAALVSAVPAIGAAPQPIQMLLTDMGVDDVEGAMAVIEPLLGLPETGDIEGALESIRNG